MTGLTWRWVLASGVLGVWATALLVDVFSTSYTVDLSLHAGVGGLLGVLLGSGLLSDARTKAAPPPHPPPKEDLDA